MIIYRTKQTIERYHIKMTEDDKDHFAKAVARKVLETEKDDPGMPRLLETYFMEAPLIAFLVIHRDWQEPPHPDNF